MDPGLQGAFPGAPGSKRQPGQGSGARREGTDSFPTARGGSGRRGEGVGAKASGSARGRCGVRPGAAPGRGLAAQWAAAGAPGPGFARAAPSSKSASSSTAAFSAGSRKGAASFGARGLAPRARQPDSELLGLPGGPRAPELPPPPPPARCQTPRVSGVCRWEGRAGASTSSFSPQVFVPLARRGAYGCSGAGPPPARAGVWPSGGSARPGEGPPVSRALGGLAAARVLGVT